MMLPILCLIVFACLTGIASTESANDCPTSVPRDEYTQVYNSSCFQFVLYRKRDYSNADKDCQSRGGTLALAKTKDVQQFLQRKAQSLGTSEPLWIGLNDRHTENTFVWEDGTTLDDAHSHWADGSGPRDGFIQHDLEDCVAMDTSRDGLWVDYHCDNALFGLLHYEKYYICEFKILPH